MLEGIEKLAFSSIRGTKDGQTNTKDIHMTERVYLYDSTLRDGAQTYGVDFSPIDKQDIAFQLDQIGIDYVEGGWPGANPTDDAFYANPPALESARLTAFGMTRRASTSTENDPGLNALLNTGVGTLCLVGKTSEFHVKETLNVSEAENLKMIGETIAYVTKKKREALFDAEHFFDGFKANPEFSLKCVKTAYENGARWVVLCDTNGGTLPFEIEAIVRKVQEFVPGSHLGVHCHNDTGNAVANSLTAVKAGVRQIQGTLNGLGERCGNANLVTIIPNLMLKMGYSTNVSEKNLKQLVKISRSLDERLNRPSDAFSPYVGSAAFAHKGGLHVSAMQKYTSSYEHIDPALVGNARTILVSNQSGRSNIIARLEEIGMDVKSYSKEKISGLVEEIKERESHGFAYDSADASLELLARKSLSSVPEFFDLRSFRVIDERRWNAKGELITLSEATAKIMVGERLFMSVAEGNGPVNALDAVLRKALSDTFPRVKEIKLVDYKVRILTPGEGSRAITRVLIETEDSDGKRWSTVGVSANVIDASYNALKDSIVYKLLRDKEGKPAVKASAKKSTAKRKKKS